MEGLHDNVLLVDRKIVLGSGRHFAQFPQYPAQFLLRFVHVRCVPHLHHKKNIRPISEIRYKPGDWDYDLIIHVGEKKLAKFLVYTDDLKVALADFYLLTDTRLPGEELVRDLRS